MFGAETVLETDGRGLFLEGAAEGVGVWYTPARQKVQELVGFDIDSDRIISRIGAGNSSHFVDSITADRGGSGVTLTHTGGGLAIASAAGSGTRQKVSGFDASNYADVAVNFANGVNPMGFSVDFCSLGALNATHNVILNWHHTTSNTSRIYISCHTSGIVVSATATGGSTATATITIPVTVAMLNDDPDGWHNVTMLIVPDLGIFGSFDGGKWYFDGPAAFTGSMNPASGTNTFRIGESVVNASYGFSGSLPFGGAIGEVSRFTSSKNLNPDAIQWWAHNRIAGYADVSCVMPASETPVWGALDRSYVGTGIRGIVGGATKVFKIGDGMAVTNIDQTALDGAAGINASTVGGYISRGVYGLLSSIGEVYQNTAAQDVGRGPPARAGGPRWLDGVGTVGVDCYMAASKANVTGDSTNYTIPFDNVVLQNGLILNTATGVITALVSGWYIVSGSLDMEGWDASTTRVAGWVYVNSTTLLLPAWDHTSNFAGGERIMGGAAERRWLDAGDMILLKAYASGGAKVADVTTGGSGANRQTSLAAHLVG
ncbi:MAG: hypothetical protein RID42_00180 [Alphaproteobacteria bacterium]